ncbi:anti-sigma factor domain-containing protein [Neobacillus sp. PS3-40]|uniref:anti-sigma-I factor RsgI family protein n=1 Tax=Neobacillus sp. PS3-40 TaxID=3070679 RepID=UPI0027DED15D|nr:anti-sigma factor domain-containing protein [Neobacillus sp. PS3-40]WML43481.1 hypothetical protein RCG20_17045 [Neobacillus sp. PS3-40]
MKKGILIEINDAHLTLLTPSGEFLHAKNLNQSYTIGEELFFYPIQEPKKNSTYILSNLFRIKPLPAFLVAFLLFLGTFIPMYQTNKAYAYMSIDVNPSIELGVNKSMKVVNLTAYNLDGKKIISHIDDWKKEKVSQVAHSILNEMKKQGYLKENHVIIISTVRIEKTEKPVEKKLTESMNEIKETVKENHLQLTVLTGSEKEMEKAHHLGITTGKYQENKMQTSHKNENSKEPIEQEINKNEVTKMNQPAEIIKKQENNRDVHAPFKKESENKNISYYKNKVVSSPRKQVKVKTVEQKETVEEDRKLEEEWDNDNKVSHSVNHSYINKQYKAKSDEHDQEKYDQEKYNQHHNK